MEIKIIINGKEFTIEEARQLYNELDKLFKDKEYLPYVPYPNPFPAPIIPYYTTSTTEEPGK